MSEGRTNLFPSRIVELPLQTSGVVRLPSKTLRHPQMVFRILAFDIDGNHDWSPIQRNYRLIKPPGY
jgi:hypothetical protein